VRPQLVPGKWFLWEDTRYLPGLADYAFCVLSGVSAVGGPDVRNLVSYFRERVQHGLNGIGCSAEFRKCGISAQQ
jgi:hypothetical protein